LPNVPFVRQSDNGSPVLTNITTANGNLFLVLLHRVSQVSGFCFLPFFFNRKLKYNVARLKFPPLWPHRVLLDSLIALYYM
jgi:hypothetical protein